MRVRATVLTSYQEGTAPTGTEIPILAGSVTLDATAEVRSTLDLITSDTWGTGSGALISPYGNEIFIERGVDYGTGETEWVSLGYFRIDEVELAGESGELRVTGSDRMSQVLDNRIVYPTQFAGSSTHEAVFDQLIRTGDQAPFPSATFDFDYDEVATTLGNAATTEESRYEFLYNIVEPMGKTMYWDHRGFLVVRDVAAPGESVFEVNTGADGVLVALSRSLSRDGVYNGVLARGDAPDDSTAPPSALAVIDDPADPLRWGGPFGSVVRFYESQFITTTLQAQTAAESMVARYTGLPYEVDLSAVPNPALEPLDVIRLVLSDGTSEDHVIEQLTIPLTAFDPLNLRTRTKNAGDEE
jgi:hypothetical protein